MKCWNCLKENESKTGYCHKCEQVLEPSPKQVVSNQAKLSYLAAEISEWGFLEEEVKSQLKRVYSGRQVRLAESLKGEQGHWPLSDGLDQRVLSVAQGPEELPPPIPLKLEPKEASNLEPVQETREQVEKPQPWISDLGNFASETPGYIRSVVGEADIRWFHSLGTVLVLAAVLGWLRASWSSYGRDLTGLLIVTSPAMLHLLSAKIRKLVPLSSRLLRGLANLLTPLAFLAIDAFWELPVWLSGSVYWTGALLVSSVALIGQAERTRERVPLFLGAICAVFAAWPHGALLTAFLSLVMGFLFFKDSSSGDLEWEKTRQSLSFYCGSFGALATLVLFETKDQPLVPLFAFFGALIFLHLPTLIGGEQNSKKRIFLQTSFTVLVSLLTRSVWSLPPGGVAIFLIFASALFLAVKPESKFALLTTRIASALGLLGVAIAFLSDATSIFSTRQTPLQLGLRLLFALGASLYFTKASRKREASAESKALFSVSFLSLLGAWTHLFLYPLSVTGLKHPDGLLPMLMGLPIFCGLTLLICRRLRKQEQKVVWSFNFALLFLGIFGLSTVASPSQGKEMLRILGLVVSLFVALAWERSLLSPALDEGSQESCIVKAGLPRFVLLCAITALYLAYPGGYAEFLSYSSLVLIAASFLLKGAYRRATWEASWVILALSFFLLHDIHWLLALGLASFALALSVAELKPSSLVLSVLYTSLLVFEGRLLTLAPFLFLPALAFAIAATVPALDKKKEREPGRVRWGFDLLMSLGIIFSSRPGGGILGSSVFCLTVLAAAAFFQINYRDPKFSRFLSPKSSLVAGITLLLCAIAHGSFEMGLVLILSGLFIGRWSESSQRELISHSLLILGTAKILRTSPWVFEPLVLLAGVLLSELYGLLKRRSQHHHYPINLGILALAMMQQSHWPEVSFHALTFGALILGLRALSFNYFVPGVTGLLLFVVRLDSIIPEGLDIRWRVLPTAILFVGLSLWRWESLQKWPRPLFQLGLALTVCPAFLFFLGGTKLWENFVWLSVAGSVYIALSFAVPKTYNKILRQAGGYTLTGWAVVSLARAALQLPWQAATLVIGLSMVGIGVYIERKRR